MTADDIDGRCAVEDHLHNHRTYGLVSDDFGGRAVGRERWDQMTGGRDYDGRKSPVQGPRRPRGHAGCFDGAIEAFVEMPKPLIVQPVARFMNVEQRQNETGFVRLTANTACRL